MAIRTKEEILESIKTRFGDSTDDDTIAFLEDVSDTYDDLETKASNTVDWEARYNENDANWRKKYTERFYNKEVSEPIEPIEPVEPIENIVPTTFDELFTTN